MFSAQVAAPSSSAMETAQVSITEIAVATANVTLTERGIDR
jgi:hypothetical protein